MTTHCTRCERDGKPDKLACLVATKDDKWLSLCYRCALAAIEAGYDVEADLSGCVLIWPGDDGYSGFPLDQPGEAHRWVLHYEGEIEPIKRVEPAGLEQGRLV